MATSYRIALTLVGLLLSFATALAQFPRTVLIEEFTAVDCTPCVQAGRDIDKVVAAKGDRVAVVRNQVKFFVNNPYATPESEGRRTYYKEYYSSQGGLPDGYVNGRSLSSMDYNTIFVTTEDELAVEAPLKIEVTQTPAVNEFSVQVKLTAGAEPIDPDSYRLHVIAVEREHRDTSLRSLPHWNGEEVLHDVMRRLMTGLDGASITVAANSSTTLNYTYTLDPSWDADKMYVVAFVQKSITSAPAPPVVVQAGFSPRPALSSVPRNRVLPEGYSFNTPAPNPAVASTYVHFTLGQPSTARLLLHDITGHLVRSVDLGRREAGSASLRLDLDGLASGAYTCTVEAGEVRMTQPLILH